MKLKFILTAISLSLLLISCVNEDDDNVEDSITKENLHPKSKSTTGKYRTHDETHREQDSIRIEQLNRDTAEGSLETVDPDKVKPPQH